MSYQPFGIFSDPLGCSGFVPSSQWLCGMYDKLIEDHGMEIDQKIAMCSGEICAIDHSYKVALSYLFLDLESFLLFIILDNEANPQAQ